MALATFQWYKQPVPAPQQYIRTALTPTPPIQTLKTSDNIDAPVDREFLSTLFMDTIIHCPSPFTAVSNERCGNDDLEVFTASVVRPCWCTLVHHTHHHQQQQQLEELTSLPHLHLHLQWSGFEASCSAQNALVTTPDELCKPSCAAGYFHARQHPCFVRFVSELDANAVRVCVVCLPTTLQAEPPPTHQPHTLPPQPWTPASATRLEMLKTASRLCSAPAAESYLNVCT